ncbi:MAG: tetratricopeptide repeat protein [Methanophagales archaeon]|nr:tetratricopeptide repeat protein [Methanophagales archaeon]
MQKDVSDRTAESAWFERGISLSYLKRYEEAIECFDKAIPLAVESYEKTIEGFENAISLLEYLVSRSGLSEEEVIEQMRKNGFEPFHIASGRNMGKIGFRKKRLQ